MLSNNKDGAKTGKLSGEEGKEAIFAVTVLEPKTGGNDVCARVQGATAKMA